MFGHHREVGDRLREVIESELTAPRPESAKNILDELVSRIDEKAPDAHETLSRKFDEAIKADGKETLYSEHAQMVLNQYLSLTRGDDDGARFVSREALAKAILFHDMDKVNSKNQFGDNQVRHDREPEHRGAVRYMNRHEGLWSGERDFRLARAMVDSDPIGAYLRGKHDDATTAYEFIRNLALQANRPDGDEATAQDVRNFFDEFHQYYQADFSSYSNQSVFVNPRTGEVEHGAPSGLTGLARDGKNGPFVRTEDGRHFEYSETASGDKKSYQQKMAELQALFDRDVTEFGGTVAGVGGARHHGLRGRNRHGDPMSFRRRDVITTKLGGSNVRTTAGLAYLPEDRTEALQNWVQNARRDPTVLRTRADETVPDALDRIDERPESIMAAPWLDPIVVAVRVNGDRFSLPRTPAVRRSR